MATKWTTLITNLKERTPELSRALAITYLQRTCNELVRDFGLTRSEEYIGLVEDTARYDFNANILKVYRAELQYAHGTPIKLEQKSIREYDLRDSGSRLSSAGIPCEIYLDPDDDGDRRVGLFPVPNLSSVAIASSTNASPIVVTTAAAHGYSDGDAVFIAGHLVNTSANGKRWVNVTGPTTFELYSDSDLSVAVAGVGIGAGTGYVGSAGSPFVRLIVVRKVTVLDDDSTIIPESMDDIVGALLSGAWSQWLDCNGDEREQATAKRNYQLARTTLQRGTGGLLADVRPVTRPYVVKRKIRK